MAEPHRVVIVGGGFAGLNAAQALRRAPVQITLVDRRNFHLFQPLLYQVATGGLSPANIAAPLRGILRRQRNVQVLLGEVVDFDPAARTVILNDGQLEYDMLLVAAGVQPSYFGKEEWEPLAPGLKTIEDATEIRRRIFVAFEAAERETDPEKRKALLTFVIVGGGPTGVELAGALAEIARYTLRREFRTIDPAEAKLVLVEMADSILGTFPEPLRQKATQSLERLGVTVRTKTSVAEIQPGEVVLRTADGARSVLPARTVLWSAGVKATPLAERLAERTGAERDKAGRIVIQPDLSIQGRPEIMVLGDMSHCRGAEGKPLPGLAPVAIQQGRYAARAIRQRLRGQKPPPFRYRDLGIMATIGRSAAVAVLWGWKLSGFVAWVLWLFIHLMQLVMFQNRLLVFVQWAFLYFTFNRSARLITGGGGGKAEAQESPPKPPQS
ncbi:MAG: NAD(P)/FAD-dependent oxidoreductase [Planctomycetia bacterium]|nr:NAD(P)/FAD-dependent oxidoreductase [Planctomycetia bacterium]